MLTQTIASTESMASDTDSLRRFLGTTTTAEDVRQTAAIKAATRWAEGYVGYPLFAASYRETVASYSSRRLMLSRTQVRAVRQLLDLPSTDDGEEILSSEFAVDRDAGFLVRDEGWEWSAPVEYNLTGTPRAGHELEPWLVDYVAGWTLGGIDTASANWSTQAGTTSTGRTLPEDIEEAVLSKAAALFDGTENVDEEQLGDLRITYNRRSVQQDKQSAHELLLDAYVRVK